MKTSSGVATTLLVLFGWVVAAGTAAAQEKSGNTYVGAVACGKCHKTEKSGNQLTVWQQSKHAKAYETLTTAAADSIAKAKGLTTKAADSESCLGCHTTGGPSSGVSRSEGVGCEACHNAGSGYKGMSTMREKAAAITAGMRDFTDPAATETFCRSCHNEKSPTAKEFVFAERWAKIKHERPAE